MTHFYFDSPRARRLLATLLLCASAGGTFAPAVRADDAALRAAVAELAAAGSYDAKARAAERIAETGHERVVDVLTALLEGELYTRRGDDRIVAAETIDGGYALTDPVTGEALGDAGRRDVARVGVNNSLRGHLRGLIATLRLSHDDPRTRLAAVEEVGQSGDLAMVETLMSLRESETDGRVRAAIDTATAVLNLDSPDAATKLAAIEHVAGYVDSTVRNRLRGIIADDAAAAELRAAAERSLEAIEERQRTYELVRTVFFGLSLGSILVLAAIGLSVTFGIMGVINMAHGELIMIGAYTTYVVQQLMPGAIEYSLLVAVPAAFLISGAIGVGIERGIVRFLYGRPLETLLATFGVSLFLQQTVRVVFSPLNRTVSSPSWMSGSVEIVQGLTITSNRLVILFFSLAVFAALLVVLRRTRLGLEMRAVTQNRAMARAMGIRTDRVDALTFGLGAGIAGIAGVALSQLTNVGPNLGQAYIVDSFMVVVFGGVGNLWGTLVSGLTLGVTNKLLEPAVGAVLAKVLVLVFLILFIQKRPRGLFPQRGRAAES